MLKKILQRFLTAAPNLVVVAVVHSNQIVNDACHSGWCLSQKWEEVCNSRVISKHAPTQKNFIHTNLCATVALQVSCALGIARRKEPHSSWHSWASVKQQSTNVWNAACNKGLSPNICNKGLLIWHHLPPLPCNARTPDVCRLGRTMLYHVVL